MSSIMSSIMSAVMPVRVRPGQTEFTRTPFLPQTHRERARGIDDGAPLGTLESLDGGPSLLDTPGLKGACCSIEPAISINIPSAYRQRDEIPLGPIRLIRAGTLQRFTPRRADQRRREGARLIHRRMKTRRSKWHGPSFVVAQKTGTVPCSENDGSPASSR
jgi:hypothetical protein